MQRPTWFDTRVSIGNIVTWVTLVGSVVWMAAEVRADIGALKEFKEKTETRMERMATDRSTDREAMIEMRTDIRLIRQILEQQLKQMTSPTGRQ